MNKPMMQVSYDLVFAQLLGFCMAEKPTTRKMNQIAWKIAAGRASTGTSSAASAQRLPNILSAGMANNFTSLYQQESLDPRSIGCPQ